MGFELCHGTLSPAAGLAPHPCPPPLPRLLECTGCECGCVDAPAQWLGARGGSRGPQRVSAAAPHTVSLANAPPQLHPNPSSHDLTAFGFYLHYLKRTVIFFAPNTTVCATIYIAVHSFSC